MCGTGQASCPDQRPGNWMRASPSAGAVTVPRLPAPHTFRLSAHQPMLRLACLCAPGPPRTRAGPDPLFRPVICIPAVTRGQYGISQVFRQAFPWLRGRSLAPDDRLCLGCCTASASGPRASGMKGSTSGIMGVRQRPFATRRARSARCPATLDAIPLPLCGPRLCRAGINLAGSRCTAASHQLIA